MGKTSRLSQWTGPRLVAHGSSLWAGLWERTALTRLGVVLATSLLLTVLAYHWDVPLPYRIGEVWAHDVRARVDFFAINDALTEDRRDDEEERLPPDKRDDPAACKAARERIPPVVELHKQGEALIRAGQPITAAQRKLLREEARAFHRSLTWETKARRAVALFVLMGTMALLVVLYSHRYIPKLAQSTQLILRVCGLVVLTEFLWLLLARPPYHGGLVPLTVTAMILAIVFRPPFALLMSFSMSIAFTASRGNNMDHLLVQVVGQAIAVLLMRNVRTRTQLIKIGFAAGLGYLAMTLATSLLTHQTKDLTISDIVRRFLWGSLAGFIVTGCLPLIERCFGIITDIRLQELANGSHPLLLELANRAPGTWNHSMTVAGLAEQAAEAIGANGLLARVGSHFHDIGKMLKPAYFVENQNGQNLHDTLEPGLSTLIIIGHVKDGIALAEQYKLPQPIIDFIQQHHGTTLVEYFYRAALRLQEELGNAPSHEGPCPLEASFRYPGPKPQTPEIGIVMLTDAVESASRALSDPAPGSLRKLVRDLIMKRLLDGQLEESGLTLTDLHVIEETLCKGLIALYHARIKYPEPRDRRAA